MIKIKKGLIGRNAYQVSKVWKLGFHSFINDCDYILRICYLRTKKHTHYVQVSFKTKDIGECPMIRKIIALIMCSFVKLYFKLDNECYCYCIGTKGDNDDFDIHRRKYKR